MQRFCDPMSFLSATCGHPPDHTVRTQSLKFGSFVILEKSLAKYCVISQPDTQPFNYLNLIYTRAHCTEENETYLYRISTITKNQKILYQTPRVQPGCEVERDKDV